MPEQKLALADVPRGCQQDEAPGSDCTRWLRLAVLQRRRKTSLGQASVIDGDTIETHGERIRLWGIDAMESDQLCRNETVSTTRAAGSLGTHSQTLSLASPDLSFAPAPDMTNTGASWPSASWDRQAPRSRSGWLPTVSRLFGRCIRKASMRKSSAAPKRCRVSGSFVEPWKYRACRRSGAAISHCSDGD